MMRAAAPPEQPLEPVMSTCLSPRSAWRPALAGLALLGALLAALPTGAAEPVKERSLGKAKASGPLMTRAELRDCIARQERGRKEASDMVAEQEQLGGEKVTLVKQGETLKEQLDTLDRTNAEAVAKYNEQALSRDAAIDALAVRTTAFNARVEAAQATRSAYVANCENRRFDERDEIAIKNGK